MSSRFMTVRETADFLGVSPQFIYRLAEATPPGIPHVRLRGKILFDIRKLELWIEHNSKGEDHDKENN